MQACWRYCISVAVRVTTGFLKRSVVRVRYGLRSLVFGLESLTRVHSSLKDQRLDAVQTQRPKAKALLLPILHFPKHKMFQKRMMRRKAGNAQSCETVAKAPL